MVKLTAAAPHVHHRSSISCNFFKKKKLGKISDSTGNCQRAAAASTSRESFLCVSPQVPVELKEEKVLCGGRVCRKQALVEVTCHFLVLLAQLKQ